MKDLDHHVSQAFWTVVFKFIDKPKFTSGRMTVLSGYHTMAEFCKNETKLMQTFRELRLQMYNSTVH